MADAGALLASPSTLAAQTSTTNAINTITVTGKTGLSIYILGITISATAAPAAAVEVDVKDGTTIILPFQIPANAFAPIVLGFGSQPVKITKGANASLVIPALGSGVISSGSLRYLYSS